MKVTIKGHNPVTGDQVKSVIDTLNDEFAGIGLKVKNLTCYIRFINEEGNLVEPVDKYGDTLDRTITFTKTKPVPDKTKKQDKKTKEEK